MWAAALALHRVSKELESGAIGGEFVRLTDFNTSRGDINDLIVAATSEVKFRGVSVSHSLSRVILYSLSSGEDPNIRTRD